MKPLKLLIILAVLALLAYAIFQGVKMIERKKIAKALTDYATSKGVKIDEAQLAVNLKKLTFKELNQLVKFGVYAQNKQYGAMMAMAGQIIPLLTKINYLSVIGG